MRNIPAEMKEKARQALERAEAFIAEGTEASARHACLELRFAIEYVVFQHFHAYLQEVSDDAMMKWTPKQVIDQMREVDPFADQTARISFGVETTPGVRPEKMQILGEDRRFSLKWANTSYNALGNFLHAPTLDQISKGQIASTEKMLTKARDIAKAVAETLNTPIIGSNFGSFYTVECDCGHTIKRRVGSFRPEDGLKCPSCGAIFDVLDDPEAASSGQMSFRLRKAQFACASCGAQQFVGAHLIKVGQVFVCACGTKVEVVLSLSQLHDANQPVPSEAAAASDTPARQPGPN